MPNPQDLRYITDVVAASLDNVRPVLIDNFFRSQALLARLWDKDKVVEDGGEEVRVPFIYGKLAGGSYRGLGNFPIGTVENITDLRFTWKQNFAAFTLPGIDVFKNSGRHKIFDLVGAKALSCRLTISDNVAGQVYSDGSNPNDITGVQLALTNTGTYGGIPRDSSPQGTAAKGNLIATGGPITLPLVNSFMSAASRGHAAKPDFAVTTTDLWDALWARAQPSQRVSGGSDHDWVTKIGFDAIIINGMLITGDDKCPAGAMFGLNTDFVEFVVGKGHDFFLRGPFPLHLQDGFTSQILLYAELAVQAPNLCFFASNLTQ